MTNILTVATAGLKSDQLTDTHHLQYPRVDYLELQRLIKTEILDYAAYDRALIGGAFKYLDTHARSDIYLALLSLLKEKKYDLVFAMSERVGIPLAGLHQLLPSPKPLVSMFTCWSQRQETVITKLNLFSAMDSIIVKCQSLKDHFITLGAPTERIQVIPFGLDHKFFSPLTDIKQETGFAMSLGEIRTRDYATLFQAVDGLPIKLLVAASGSWYAREKNTSLQIPVPENVTLSGGFSRKELKKLYAQSQFIVLPIYDSIFSAGATAVLEAMCMGRAVIVTRSRGIVDYVIDGETGILVESGNVIAMRDAIQYLLDHPQETQRMGANARCLVEEKLNLKVYVERIAQLLQM